MPMLPDLVAALLVMLLAFAAGFAIRRGSICMVDAAKQWIVDRKSLRARAFAAAAGASACLILPLSWLFQAPDILAPSFPITPVLLASGAAFGLGARVNGGCAFGTLSRLSGGELDFTGTLAGIGLGALVAIRHMANPPPAPPLFDSPGLLGVSALIGFAILARPAFQRRHLQNIRSVFVKRAVLLRPFTAMLIIGICGSLLFALAGSWTHMSIIEHQSAAFGEGQVIDIPVKALAGAAALVGGAIYAALRSGRFRLRLPTLGGWSRCFAGGTVMGCSAALIPGGNGALLIHGIPSGAVNAWAAFVFMALALALSFLPARLAK